MTERRPRKRSSKMGLAPLEGADSDYVLKGYNPQGPFFKDPTYFKVLVAELAESAVRDGGDMLYKFNAILMLTAQCRQRGVDPTEFIAYYRSQVEEIKVRFDRCLALERVQEATL